LHVIYLVFNEGYSATSGDSLTRADLSAEAIRLGRLLVELLPEPEALGLLALMLLHESRRRARTSASGELILLADQDRSLWDHELIAEGGALVDRALASRRIGPYTLQAAIAAVHAEAPAAAETDWSQIVGLYDVLMRAAPSPVVELNRAVAVAMRDGPMAGLALIDTILERGDLADYALAHSARAELCRRLGKTGDARLSYERALALTRQEPQRRFLDRAWPSCRTDPAAPRCRSRAEPVRPHSERTKHQERKGTTHEHAEDRLSRGMARSPQSPSGERERAHALPRRLAASAARCRG
jgi:RNA polymerase sigma-70 factor (ECF subfamily)